jgi:hypothetical protein
MLFQLHHYLKMDYLHFHLRQTHHRHHLHDQCQRCFRLAMLHHYCLEMGLPKGYFHFPLLVLFFHLRRRQIHHLIPEHQKHHLHHHRQRLLC